jgi:signal transduction histidine kinase
MRFKINLAIDSRTFGNRLPINYQYELSAWIYKIIACGDEQYAAWLHENGFSEKHRNFKMFVFSNLYSPGIKFEQDRLIFYSDKASIIGSFFDANHRLYAPYDSIPQALVDAIVSAEDARFWEHGGFDFSGFSRAMFNNVKSMNFRQGGSTLSQQTVKNVFGRKDKILGQVVTINDVSETKQLTLEKERARIASGLHDSMGNRLIASINNLNLAYIMSAQEESRTFIDNAATSVGASLMTLRQIVEGLAPVNFNEVKLIPMIESVVNRISASGVNAEIQASDNLEELPTCLKEFIYNACQEALTNSVIHGKAENIVINLEYTDGILSLSIVDDGQGCGAISKNNGLTAMEGRAQALGGSIRFDASSCGGFGIYAEIPLAECDFCVC